MRPDRAVVIRHRVVPGFRRADGADAPAAEYRRREERERNALGALGRGNTGEQDLSGVRRDHPAGPLCAVQRERVCGKILAPELRFEFLAQGLCLRGEPAARCGCPAPRPARRRGVWRRIRRPGLRTARSGLPPGGRLDGRLRRRNPSILDSRDPPSSGDDIRRNRRRRGRRSDRSRRAPPRRSATAHAPSQGRRSAGNTRRAAAETRASRRCCRSSGRTAPRADSPFLHGASRAESFPGSASRSGSTAVAWVAARNPSTPRAMLGSSHSVISAVMMPSRPKGVLNQGIPAYGVRPLGRVGDEHVQVRHGAPDDFVVYGIRAVDAGGTRARVLQGMAGGAQAPIERAAGPFALRRAVQSDAQEYPARRARMQRQFEGRSGRG